MNRAAAIRMCLVLTLGVLVLASCGGDDRTYREGMFGTPYPMKKLADFRFYEASHLSFSRATVLTRDLLSESVKKNADVSGYGDKTQKYNYVIDHNGDILVAVWNTNSTDDIQKVINNHDVCTPGTPSFALEDIVHEGTMINFSSETKASSLCWLAVDGGLLDALSKHFMLAQGEGSTIDDYDEAKWAVTEVAYAGEMTVANCTFWINNNSGTYQPTYDSTVAGQLVNYFSNYPPLKMAPTTVVPGSSPPPSPTTPLGDEYKIPGCKQ